MSAKSQEENAYSDRQKALKARFCTTCKNIGYILAPDELNYGGKTFIEECPDCNP